jgi:hypothetical protein
VLFLSRGSVRGRYFEDIQQSDQQIVWMGRWSNHRRNGMSKFHLTPVTEALIGEKDDTHRLILDMVNIGRSIHIYHHQAGLRRHPLGRCTPPPSGSNLWSQDLLLECHNLQPAASSRESFRAVLLTATGRPETVAPLVHLYLEHRQHITHGDYSRPEHHPLLAGPVLVGQVTQRLLL